MTELPPYTPSASDTAVTLRTALAADRAHDLMLRAIMIFTPRKSIESSTHRRACLLNGFFLVFSYEIFSVISYEQQRLEPICLFQFDVKSKFWFRFL